jgi:hypothetical protein
MCMGVGAPWLSGSLSVSSLLSLSLSDQREVKVGKATRAETEEEKTAPAPAAALAAAHLIGLKLLVYQTQYLNRT